MPTIRNGYQIEIFEQPAAAAEAAAALMVRRVQADVDAHDRCHMALAGGSTPKTLYRLLASEPWRQKFDWQALHFYFGDERDVPLDHPDSNYRMASEHLLNPLNIDPQQVHPMRAGDNGVRQQAWRYGQLLLRNLPHSDDGFPQLDLLLLGLGPDGHTASLFPRTCILHQQSLPVDAVYVQSKRNWRISLTPPTVERARRVIFLVAGADKADAVARTLSGPDDADLPVRRLDFQGEVYWMLDRAAAARLESS